MLIPSVPTLSWLILAPFAQGERLNAPLPEGLAGDVSAARLAGNGGRVVYLADARRDEFSELWSVPSDGSAPARRLHGHLASEVMAFELTPDGTRAVYRTQELFVVPTDGSTMPRRLSTPLPPFGSVGIAYEGELDFWIDPVGTRVAYLADASANDFLELFVAPLDGSAGAVRLSAPGLGEAEWSLGAGLAFTPDGSRVVFQTLGMMGQRELWSAPSDGSVAPVRIASANVNSSGVARFSLTLDGVNVVFNAAVDTFGNRSLFRVPVAGGSAPALLHAPSDASRSIDSFAVGVGNRVAFVADLVQDGWNELFSVPIDASEPPRHLSALPNATRDVFDFELVPGRELAVYQANQRSGTERELFVVPLDASAAPRRLSATLVSGGNASLSSVTPDGLRLLYIADQEVHGRRELYSVPIDGPATVVQLSSASPDANDDVYDDVRPFAQGARAAFRTFRGEEHQPFENGAWWTAPVDGSSAPVRLAGPPEGDWPVALHAPAQLDELVFLMLAPSGATEVFWSPGDGSTAPRKLNGSLTGGPARGVEAFLGSPDGRWCVYRVDQELFSVELRGGRVRELNGLPGEGPLQERFRITPDSRRVLYRAWQDSSDGVELFSAPLDGGAPAVRLAPGMVLEALGTVAGEDFLSTSDSTRVLFVVRGGLANLRQLWSAPVDGSAAPVRLDDPSDGALLANTVELFPRLTGAPERVVYAAAAGPGLVELRVTAADGSAAPLALLPVAARVTRFEPTSDGTACLFLQRASANAPAELFVVPLDASATPLRLSHALAAPGEVLEFALGCDTRLAYLASDPQPRVWVTARGGSVVPFEASAVGSLHGPVLTGSLRLAGAAHVVYLALPLTGSANQLWSAPLDGSAPPVRLDVPLVVSGSVRTYLIAPGLERLVYRADRGFNDIHDLWSVPIEGSAAPVLLSLRTSFSDVEHEYRVSVDGSWVMYRADQETNGRTELFLVPIDASRTPRKVNGTLLTGGVQANFAFAGERLLYLAAEEHTAQELFASWSAKAPRRR